MTVSVYGDLSIDEQTEQGHSNKIRIIHPLACNADWSVKKSTESFSQFLAGTHELPAIPPTVE
jgi:hypothetical protein